MALELTLEETADLIGGEGVLQVDELQPQSHLDGQSRACSGDSWNTACMEGISERELEK